MSLLNDENAKLQKLETFFVHRTTICHYFNLDACNITLHTGSSQQIGVCIDFDFGLKILIVA